MKTKNQNNKTIITSYKESVEDAAKKYANIIPTAIIDEETRYYAVGIDKYDAFIAGAKWYKENH